jgi:plastocyanin
MIFNFTRRQPSFGDNRMQAMLTRAVLAISIFVVAPVSHPSVVHAEDTSFTLTIKDHRFAPSEIIVPMGQKVKLVIKNLDATPEEFESHDLNREKIVAGGGEITLYIGPLKAGTYGFFGEFNQATAQGRIIAK